jgi:hypothetical protein
LKALWCWSDAFERFVTFIEAGLALSFQNNFQTRHESVDIRPLSPNVVLKTLSDPMTIVLEHNHAHGDGVRSFVHNWRSFASGMLPTSSLPPDGSRTLHHNSHWGKRVPGTPRHAPFRSMLVQALMVDELS